MSKTLKQQLEYMNSCYDRELDGYYFWMGIHDNRADADSLEYAAESLKNAEIILPIINLITESMDTDAEEKFKVFKTELMKHIERYHKGKLAVKLTINKRLYTIRTGVPAGEWRKV